MRNDKLNCRWFLTQRQQKDDYSKQHWNRQVSQQVSSFHKVTTFDFVGKTQDLRNHCDRQVSRNPERSFEINCAGQR